MRARLAADRRVHLSAGPREGWGGREPRVAAAEIAAATPGLNVEAILDTPFALFGRDAGHAADELRRRQDVFGFDGVTTHQPSMDALGEVMAAYRGGE